MQNINWDMMTQFVFPEELGLVEEVISCNIIPRWQQIETEDSIQLHGIYHITIYLCVLQNPEVATNIKIDTSS